MDADLNNAIINLVTAGILAWATRELRAIKAATTETARLERRRHDAAGSDSDPV